MVLPPKMVISKGKTTNLRGYRGTPLLDPHMRPSTTQRVCTSLPRQRRLRCEDGKAWLSRHKSQKEKPSKLEIHFEVEGIFVRVSLRFFSKKNSIFMQLILILGIQRIATTGSFSARSPNSEPWLHLQLDRLRHGCG